MAKGKELVQAPLATLPAAPDFMEQDGTLGMEAINKKIRPPFLKIVQKQSSDELISEFGIGAAILVPDRIPIVSQEAKDRVRIVPIYFFSEYLQLTSIELKDQEPMIANRSIDPASDIARRCMDKSLWSMEHPKYPGDQKYNYRFAESLNFVCFFQEAHLDIGMPFVMPFSRGSFGRGQRFCNAISMRKRPPFGCVFALGVDPVSGKNAKGEWRMPIIENPPENPWVTNAEEYELYKETYFRFKALHEADEIDVVHDDIVEEASVGGETGQY